MRINAERRADPATSGQPPVRVDTISVLPATDHLGLLTHGLTYIRVIPRWPQFILVQFVRGQRSAIHHLAPGPECAMLHRDAFIVVQKAHQRIVRLPGVCSYVYGPLGGVVTVKLLLFYGCSLLLFVA